MKCLVYYVCFGERYKRFLNKSLDTLFRIGKYVGDVVVLTHFDKKEIFQHPNIKVININLQSDNMTFYRNSKPRIIEYVNLNSYDFVVYLDCDVLINTPRLMQLFESWSSASEKIFIQRDIVSIKRNKPYCGSEVLSSEERNKNGHHAFNAGIIATSSKNFFNLCTLWSNKNLEHSYTKDDQGNLVFVILRNFLDKIQYTNDTTITNRKNDEKREETLLHFLTKSENAFYSYYDKYLKDTND